MLRSLKISTELRSLVEMSGVSRAHECAKDEVNSGAVGGAERGDAEALEVVFLFITFQQRRNVSILPGPLCFDMDTYLTQTPSRHAE